MANFAEITVYKDRMAQAFCTSDRIAELLRLADQPLISGKDLMYSRVFPYAHVPNVSEEGRSFICFDIDVPAVKSNIIKTVQISIYVMAHQNIMRLPDGGGMRIDVLASEVDKIMNGSTQYGLGTVELMSMRGFAPITGYYGRELKYRVSDINRSVCEQER